MKDILHAEVEERGYIIKRANGTLYDGPFATLEELKQHYQVFWFGGVISKANPHPDFPVYPINEDLTDEAKASILEKFTINE